MNKDEINDKKIRKEIKNVRIKVSECKTKFSLINYFISAVIFFSI